MEIFCNLHYCNNLLPSQIHVLPLPRLIKMFIFFLVEVHLDYFKRANLGSIFTIMIKSYKAKDLHCNVQSVSMEVLFFAITSAKFMVEFHTCLFLLFLELLEVFFNHWCRFLKNGSDYMGLHNASLKHFNITLFNSNILTSFV
jgi:hypothetical protein